MNSFNDDILTAMKVDFPMFDLSFEQLMYVGKIPIFIAKVNCSEEILETHWGKLVHQIAFDYQSQIDDEFAIWNIYLFFVCNTPISNTLKYKIENDTFSSRKIVIVGPISNEEIIAQHIRNNDINFKNDAISPSSDISYDPVIAKYISRQRTSKRLTEEHRNALKKIITDLESQNNEI